MAFETSTVSIGDLTRKSNYDLLLSNTIFLYQRSVLADAGGVPLGAQTVPGAKTFSGPVTLNDSLTLAAAGAAAEGSQQIYLDKNDICLQLYTSGAWEDRLRIHASDGTDDYTVTLTDCPIHTGAGAQYIYCDYAADTSGYLLHLMRANYGTGVMYIGLRAGTGRSYITVDPGGDLSLTVSATGGSPYYYPISFDASTGTTTLLPGTGRTLSIGRVSSNPSIKGADDSTGDSVIMDSYDSNGVVSLQYYVVGDVVLCYGSGTGGGTVGLGTANIEAWHANYIAIEAYRSAIMMGRGSSDLYLCSNLYYDGVWKYKAAAVAGVLAVSGRNLSWSSAASGTIDTEVTGLQGEMKAVGGTTTYLSLGGAAGGSDRDVYIELASDSSVFWDESEGSVSVYAAGTRGARFRAATSELMMASTASPGNVYCATGAGLHVLFVSTSSGRYKTAIKDLGIEYADALLKLRPTRFHSLCEADPKDREYHGFIAEEVDRLGVRAWVEYEEDGVTPSAISYSAMIPAVVRKLQQYEERIKALEGVAVAPIG